MNNTEKIISGAEKAGIEYRLNAPMSEYTSFKTGGPADVLILPKNELELRRVLSLCDDEGIRPFVFGNGSNLLVSDDGIRGVSVRLASNFDDIRLLNDDMIFCTAGTKLAKLCTFALENSLTGLEFAYGIPGTAGGAAYMNAGAYGGEMKDVLVSCNHLDYSGNPGRLTGDQLALSYRRSAYTDKYFVITGITVKLQKGEREEINARMKDFLSRRVDKQPLDLPSAGSFFKRPEGYFAGKLVQDAGLKGKTIGGAQVSEKHSGFLINIGGATAQDILDLIAFCQKEVRAQFGVTLETEVKIVGEE